ncbi:AAA family ATPase [[Mycoplasma] anseris]|uniref:DUF2075 domain-containing protein n=1 Tax=[Mycoplasma] anseris TaxID=92400 RepID=A0A2Z4ND89_9BACT|nr:AAA family ATPase [[Mycoplasma] anseris]AWX69487.1 DUF2075 domain-containing protein [[Mycoplasma] anseris]
MADVYKISGSFQKLLFAKPNSSYCVFSFKISNYYENKDIVKNNNFNTISVVVNDKEIEIGKFYDIFVEKNIHSRYKDSYILINCLENETWKLNYIIKFLETSHFPGIGEAKARKIVEKYGFDSLNQIANSLNITAKDLGITEASFKKARSFLNNNPQTIEDQLFFLKLNLSPSFYEKINQSFNSLKDFLDQYKDNFYNFYFDNTAVSLLDLDKLSFHFLQKDSLYKKPTYLYKALSDYFFNTGNTKVKLNDFYKYYFKYCDKISSSEFKEYLKILINDNRVLLFDNKTYITTYELREMEQYIAQRLLEVKEKKPLIKFIKRQVKAFHERQNEALNLALNNNLVLITGSPGTGKTLITNEIIENLLEQFHEDNIAVVTPTGRATININKTSSKKAVTIHSFLNWDVELNSFQINETNPENIECLIIDEFSMVSVDVFYHLLKGLNHDALSKIILVGDKNQLPAIGPGYLIRDLMNDGIFDVIELSKIYRQSENFEIITDAVAINQQKTPSFKGKHSRFQEIQKTDLSSHLISEIQSLIKKGYAKKDIAILSPIYNYQTGIDHINEDITAFWREYEQTSPIKINKRQFAIGDKVLNTINDPTKKVFNGEIGYITRFDYDEDNNVYQIAISFEDDSKVVVFSKKDFLQKIIPAYCTSVHKYQGSECPVVLTVLFSEAKKLLSKKLIYTAITRAKNLSIIFGETSALEIGINNDNDSNRETCLLEIWQALKEKK